MLQYTAGAVHAIREITTTRRCVTLLSDRARDRREMLPLFRRRSRIREVSRADCDDPWGHAAQRWRCV